MTTRKTTAKRKTVKRKTASKKVVKKVVAEEPKYDDEYRMGLLAFFIRKCGPTDLVNGEITCEALNKRIPNSEQPFTEEEFKSYFDVFIGKRDANVKHIEFTDTETGEVIEYV